MNQYSKERYTNCLNTINYLIDKDFDNLELGWLASHIAVNVGIPVITAYLFIGDRKGYTSALKASVGRLCAFYKVSVPDMPEEIPLIL